MTRFRSPADITFPPLVHYGLLIGIVLLGVGLRLWQLDSKPLWLDETITAVFALGRDYGDVPTGELLSLDAIAQFFQFTPATCGAIAQRLATDSSHPPLYFCLLHRWLGWLNPSFPYPEHLTWALRSFSALMGTLALLAMYLLNRLAFSPTTGLLGAALMAVSPFAVYLSQEARHYTLPMLLITLAMMASILVFQDLLKGKARLWAWLLWVMINSLGLYTHYFFAMAIVAQIIALTGLWLWHQRVLYPRMGIWLVGAIALLATSYLPWLPTLLSHANQPETEWLTLASGWGRLNPLYQLLAGWVTMLMLLPVEGQPSWLAIPLGFLMLSLFAWIVFQAWRGCQNYCSQRTPSPIYRLLLAITGLILLQFLAIIYGLGKDLSLAPRYNFVYYPGLCALLSLCLLWIPIQRSRFSQTLSHWKRSPDIARKTPALILVLGLLGSAFVVNGLGFQKSFNPALLSDPLLPSSPQASTPTLLLFQFPSPQELAFDLSLAYHLQAQAPDSIPPIRLAFLPQTGEVPETPPLNLSANLPTPFTLWSFAAPPRDRFPRQLNFGTSNSPIRCTTATNAPNTITGLAYEYQQYRCQSTALQAQQSP